MKLSDSGFLLEILSDGEWHRLDDILRESQARRGHGMTVHSRAADLRKQGHVVDTMQRRNGQGRTDSFYKLVAEDWHPGPGVDHPARANTREVNRSGDIRASHSSQVGTLEEAVAGRGRVDPPATGSVTVSSSVPDFLADPSLSVPEDGPGTLDSLTLFDTVPA